MAQITGGSITYGKKLQKSQYEPEHAEARIDFAVGEKEDHAAVIELASEIAKTKVQALIGMANMGEPKKPLGRPPKQPPTQTVTGPEDPSGIPKELQRTRQAETLPADPAAVDWSADETPATVTDEHLLSSITKHNEQVQNPTGIKKLIRDYLGGPGSANAIPQEKRTAFLAELVKVPKQT